MSSARKDKRLGKTQPGARVGAARKSRKSALAANNSLGRDGAKKNDREPAKKITTNGVFSCCLPPFAWRAVCASTEDTKAAKDGSNKCQKSAVRGCAFLQGHTK
jgi:hypothetical protein